jgi:hypothetical protein
MDLVLRTSDFVHFSAVYSLASSEGVSRVPWREGFSRAT